MTESFLGVRVGLAQELRIAKEGVTPLQRIREERETYGAYGMAGRACVEGGPRVMDGFFERGQILVVREPMMHNGCEAQLREGKQDVFRG